MVVASGGWVQNASFPVGHNNSNLNQGATQNNKMTAKGILICRDNSHPFEDRTLALDQSVKIGRSVARSRAALNNAIFDCKVLSRNHALLWYSDGKFYLQDTRSSNGTFINNQRLSTSGLESSPRELCSGDIVQFGVDVVESTKKLTHGCIVATLKLYLPDGKEAKASTFVSSPAGNVSLEDMYKLNEVMQDATRRERALCSKLEYLQQMVGNTRKAVNQSWTALIAEDRLLSWVDTIENQLAVYSKNYTEDKIKSELVKLQEEKAHYQNVAKEALQKVLDEKAEVTQNLMRLKGRLSETEEECQSLHNVAKYNQMELEGLSNKYTETQKKLQETTNKLMECEENLKDAIENAEEEKQAFHKKLGDHRSIEKNLQARLCDSRLNSVNIYKQITALRNYMQTLQNMSIKFVIGEVLDSKDEENPIEAIIAILNKLNSIHVDNVDLESETNLYISKDEQDNQINSQDIDSNQLTTINSNESFCKEQLDDSLSDRDNLTAYILPPPSRRTLINGNANLDNVDNSTESDANSEATDDTCSITSEDMSEKSVVEIKKEEPDVTKESIVSLKTEVRFASGENGKMLEVHYEPADQAKEDLTSSLANDTIDLGLTTEHSDSIGKDVHKARDVDVKDSGMETNEECEGEHLEGDYIKTLKPPSKSEGMQQGLHSREYILQTFIRSLDSLKGEDTFEAQQVVKRELDDLRDWLIREQSEVILDKLKELYYRVKNETQRVQEVNEELVILKEKYNVFVEEKTELSKKYQTLKAQCGDLLNATYTVPLHYVAPLAIALVWMLLEKIF